MNTITLNENNININNNLNNEIIKVCKICGSSSNKFQQGRRKCIKCLSSIRNNRCKQYFKEYYLSNRDKMLEHQKQYYLLNRHDILQQQRKYQQNKNNIEILL